MELGIRWGVCGRVSGPSKSPYPRECHVKHNSPRGSRGRIGVTRSSRACSFAFPRVVQSRAAELRVSVTPLHKRERGAACEMRHTRPNRGFQRATTRVNTTLVLATPSRKGAAASREAPRWTRRTGRGWVEPLVHGVPVFGVSAGLGPGPKSGQYQEPPSWSLVRVSALPASQPLHSLTNASGPVMDAATRSATCARLPAGHSCVGAAIQHRHAGWERAHGVAMINFGILHFGFSIAESESVRRSSTCW
jgi:hypothetical protein